MAAGTVLLCLNSVELPALEKLVAVQWDWGCCGACVHLVCGSAVCSENRVVPAQSVEWRLLSGYTSVWGRELV